MCINQSIKKALSISLMLLLNLPLMAILPNRKYRFYPEKLGLIYKDLEVKTTDGFQIKTWFFPAQPSLTEQEMDVAWEHAQKKSYQVFEKTPRPTIVIANGDAGNMSFQQLHHAQFFTSKGYNVVTFDWRGFGESSDWEMDNNFVVYSEMLTDYDAVLKEVLRQPEVDTSKIAVFGWSTGAYLSMAAASKYDEVKVFVAIGLMTSFQEALPLVEKARQKTVDNLVLPKDYPLELQPINLAPTWNKATFLVVGEKDDRTPVWMSERLYSLFPSSKEIWVVEGAEHGGMKGPFRDFNVFHQCVLSFFDHYFK